LEMASWLRLLSGDIPALMAHSAEGVATWKALGREGEGARTLIPAGFATALTGSFPEGVAMVHHACDMSRARNDRFGVALGLNLLAELSRAAGDYEQALAQNEEMMGILRGMGHVIESSLFAINLAWCYLHKGDFSRAAEAVVETLELGQQMNNAFNLAYYIA